MRTRFFSSALMLFIVVCAMVASSVDADAARKRSRSGNSGYELLEGDIADQPVKIYLQVSRNGSITGGKYAYVSTLRKYGNKSTSYLTFKSVTDNNDGSYSIDVYNAQGQYVETWDVELMFGRSMGLVSINLLGTCTLANGNSYDICAAGMAK